MNDRVYKLYKKNVFDFKIDLTPVFGNLTKNQMGANYLAHQIAIFSISKDAAPWMAKKEGKTIQVFPSNVF